MGEGMEWIYQNRAWLFDGLLVAVPLAIVSWFFAKHLRSTRTQSQKGGQGSTNIQAGTNITFGSGANSDGPESKGR